MQNINSLMTYAINFGTTYRATEKSRIILLPEGHSTMDKAHTYHTGGQGLNQDTTKVYGAPILLGTPALTLSQCLLPSTPA